MPSVCFSSSDPVWLYSWHVWTLEWESEHTHHFNGHFPVKLWLPPWFLVFYHSYSEDPHRTSQILFTPKYSFTPFFWSTLVCTSPPYINCHFKGFELEVFTGQMLFLLPNQQHQSTEGIGKRKNVMLKCAIEAVVQLWFGDVSVREAGLANQVADSTSLISLSCNNSIDKLLARLCLLCHQNNLIVAKGW